ncbi:hypothetical protein B0O99DRAFT_626775 [Bisporella sp. PMI_857]|nr:hypothetical protein B0O99DRAFT_626775 [Bisporella sp. PMI_857]
MGGGVFKRRSMHDLLHDHFRIDQCVLEPPHRVPKIDKSVSFCAPSLVWWGWLKVTYFTKSNLVQVVGELTGLLGVRRPGERCVYVCVFGGVWCVVNEKCSLHRSCHHPSSQRESSGTRLCSLSLFSLPPAWVICYLFHAYPVVSNICGCAIFISC